MAFYTAVDVFPCLLKRFRDISRRKRAAERPTLRCKKKARENYDVFIVVVVVSVVGIFLSTLWGCA